MPSGIQIIQISVSKIRIGFETPAIIEDSNDILKDEYCSLCLFVEKLHDLSKRILFSATRPNGKKEEKVV